MPEIAQFTKTLRLPETVTAVCAAESVAAPFPWKNSIPEIRQPFADRVNRFANEFDAAAFDTRDRGTVFLKGRDGKPLTLGWAQLAKLGGQQRAAITEAGAGVPQL